MRYFIFYYIIEGNFIDGGHVRYISENGKFPNRNRIKKTAALMYACDPEEVLITGFNEFKNREDFDNFFAEQE